MQKLFSKQAGDTLKNGRTFRHWLYRGETRLFCKLQDEAGTDDRIWQGGKRYSHRIWRRRCDIVPRQ